MFDNVITKLTDEGVKVNVAIDKKALVSLGIVIFAAIFFSNILKKFL